MSCQTTASHSALASFALRAHAHDATLSNRNVHETFHPCSIFPRMHCYYIYSAYLEYTYSYTHYLLMSRHSLQSSTENLERPSFSLCN